MTIDEHHPLIKAMCDAAFGKGANHKLKRRKEMLRAFQAAQEFYAPDRGEMRAAVARLGDAVARARQAGVLQ